MLNVVKVTKTHFATVLPRIVNLSKNSSYLCFAQCSKWGQIITPSVSLLSVANIIKIVLCHCFAQGSKFGQRPLYSQFCSGWQIWSKQLFPILFPVVVKLIKYQFFCIFAQDGKCYHNSSFPYFKSGIKQSWLKYHFFKLSLKIANLIKKNIIYVFLVFIWYHKWLTNNLDTNQNFKNKMSLLSLILHCTIESKLN